MPRRGNKSVGPEGAALVGFRVNGEPVQMAFAPHKTLLEVLREDLRLTGTKHGCELGECGTCAVLVDGKPVLSCLYLGVECEGKHVETVEGMAGARGLHPLQKAFADLGSAQCGYCTPGFLLTRERCWRRNGSRRGKRSRRLWPAISAAAPATSRSSRRWSSRRHGCVARRPSPGGNLYTGPTSTRAGCSPL